MSSGLQKKCPPCGGHHPNDLKWSIMNLLTKSNIAIISFKVKPNLTSPNHLQNYLYDYLWFQNHLLQVTPHKNLL